MEVHRRFVDIRKLKANNGVWKVSSSIENVTVTEGKSKTIRREDTLSGFLKIEDGVERGR